MVLCKQCLTPLENGQCLKCTQGQDSQVVGPTIPYELSARTQKLGQSSGWKQEVLAKLNLYKTRETLDAGSQEVESSTDLSQREKLPSSIEFSKERVAKDSSPESKAFRYRIKTSPPVLREKRRISYRSEKKSIPLEKPVIRPLVKSDGNSVFGKGQGRLKLDQSNSLISRQMSKPRVQKPEIDQGEIVSVEVLFSRMLAGLIDVLIAVVAGGAVGFLVPYHSGTSVLVYDFVRDALLAAGIFFLFSCTFLLYLSGQTLGMAATDLRLITYEGKNPGLSDVALRVFSFLFVMSSLIGLFWAFFNRQQRCWHDYFSRTLVVPVNKR